MVLLRACHGCTSREERYNMWGASVAPHGGAAAGGATVPGHGGSATASLLQWQLAKCDTCRDVRHCPSIHYEIHLALSQICGVRKKPPPQLLSSRQCAPHSWCRHDGADRVEKAASDGFGNCGMREPSISVSSDTIHKLLASPSTFSHAFCSKAVVITMLSSLQR